MLVREDHFIGLCSWLRAGPGFKLNKILRFIVTRSDQNKATAHEKSFNY